MDEIDDYDKMIEQITEIQRSYAVMAAQNQVLRDVVVVLASHKGVEGVTTATPELIAHWREQVDVVIDRAEDGTITVTVKEKTP